MATKKEKPTMKTYFISLCLVLIAGLADATTQSSVSQDKPTRVYVKSYNESCVETYNIREVDSRYEGEYCVTYSTNTYTYSSTFNELMAFNENTPGTLCQHDQESSYYADYPGGDLAYVATYWGSADVDDLSTLSWPSGSWPAITGTWIETRTEKDVTGQIGGGSTDCNNKTLGCVPVTSTNASTSISTNATLPIVQEHCTINVSGTSGTIGTFRIVNYTAHRSAETVMKLQTGGRATSKMKNLFGLTASCYQSIVASQPSAPYWSVTDTESVPSQNITIGSYGALNANGVMYKIISDNDDVDVTPRVAGVDYCTFGVSATKYHSYFDLFVQQANPGYSFYPTSYEYDVGHAFWQFRTDAPADALQYISTNITKFLGTPWGFYPTNNPAPSLTNLFTVPGYIQNDGWPTAHSYNIKRTFYIGFPDLLQGLIFTRGIFNAPPMWCATSYNCVGAARGAGFDADIFGLPWDTTPQNFGVTLIEMYPAPGLVIGPFDDETDIFYSSAPY